MRRTGFVPGTAPESSAEGKDLSEPEDGSPSRDLPRLITGYRVTQALYVVAKLGVADVLADGPKDAGVLAERLGVQPRPLFRVMRMLAGHGIFTQDGENRFGLTALGAHLRTDHPVTVRHSAIMHGELQYQTAGDLLHTVQSGETAFDHLYGANLFAYLGAHPEDSATFNAAMADTVGVWSSPIEGYDLSKHRLVVDVGGGRGTLLAALLARNPALRGILFDLPAGAAEAAPYLQARGVADRCEIRTGDAFEAIPKGGDVIIFSRVLHNWPDDKVRVLLANAREATAEDGVLLLWESVVPEGATPSPTKDIDLTMLFLLGGAERTESEWRALLSAAGFALVKVTKTGGMFDMIEAKPA